ncbi:MAG: hypothetical protein AB7J28_15945 [Hyphomonadaceae bacterium]
MRRRRRRSYGRSDPRTRLILFGAAGAALLLGFIVLVNLADNAQPPREEVRIALPDALKD